MTCDSKILVTCLLVTFGSLPKIWNHMVTESLSVLIWSYKELTEYYRNPYRTNYFLLIDVMFQIEVELEAKKSARKTVQKVFHTALRWAVEWCSKENRQGGTLYFQIFSRGLRVPSEPCPRPWLMRPSLWCLLSSSRPHTSLRTAETCGGQVTGRILPRRSSAPTVPPPLDARMAQLGLPKERQRVGYLLR